MIEYNCDIGKFINDYSINNNGKDYSMIIDLSYKYKVKYDSVCIFLLY